MPEVLEVRAVKLPNKKKVAKPPVVISGVGDKIDLSIFR
jgi:hypothetical protein